MLGAPTLLYRHAPSYLDPSNRPSTLTPQQLSMALYMNENPIKDWFTNRQSQELRNAHSSITKSAFLTSTHVPQPPRPWGRPHAWDWRHGHVTSKSKAVKNLRRQAELDANDLVEDLHCANRSKVRWFWEDVEQRNRDEQQTSNIPTNNDQRRRNMTGFNVFCSEYINQLKQSTSDSEASSGPRYHFQFACKAWNELSDEERYAHGRKAEKMNGKSEEQKSNAKSKHRKKKEKRSKVPKQKRTKGKTTGFNIFRSEYMQSNAVAENATDADRKSHLLKCSKLAGSEWKKMTEEEKSVYNETAASKNENIVNQSPVNPEDNKVEGGGEEQRSVTTQERGGVYKSKGRTTGFHVFQSEYVLRWKQSNPNASADDRKGSMIKCCKEASSDWKEMTEEEKAVYKDKAQRKNENRVDQLEEKQEQQNAKKKKGKTTGFNIFRTESWIRLRQSSPLPDGASTTDKGGYVKKCNKQISAVWKEMPEAEKSRYKQDAKMRNELSLEVNFEAGGRKDSTSEGADFYSGKHYQRQEQLIGERQKYESNPYAKLGDLSGDGDGTDIQLLHDRYLSASNEQLVSCPDYFSPFRRQDARFGFHLGDGVGLEKDDIERLPMKQSKCGSNDDQLEGSKETPNIKDDDENMIEEEMEVDQVQGVDSGTTTKAPDQFISEDWCGDRNGVGGPSGFGNCLITVHCRCQYCEHRSPSWFLIRPTGENLSCVSMSKICLPRDSSFHGGQEGQKVDVGGRILQISQCGEAVSYLKSTNEIICLVVRTSQYCSVVHAKAVIQASREKEKCSTDFHMQEKTRIDLRASGSLYPSYLPVHVTCDPKATISYYTSPSFAILSCDYLGSCTTIHRVALKDDPDVNIHSLSSSLADISLIEFCPNDRMVVWAAARSLVMPKLSTGFFQERNGTVTGYGHSLFRVDLRNDSSSLVWSPSHAEYITEGLHSINGIMPDATSEHVLWVSSSSACKIWALDVRYKSVKVVVSWSLPSLCDDFGSQMAVTGIYGGGVLMSQPGASCLAPLDDRSGDSRQNNQLPTMFSLNKAPNSYAVGVHQFPSAMPRFHTKPLESAGFQEVPKLKYDISSIARSAIFPLPDVSGSIFNIGLATLQCSSRTCLKEKQLGNLGYQTPPACVTFAITMTSLGDIYCHSLLETNAMKETQASQFPGLPLGTKAIPVPGKVEAAAMPNPCHLSILLSNEFPVPSSSITPYAVLHAGDCCSFKSFGIGDILNNGRPPPDNSLQVYLEDQIENAYADQVASACNAPRSVYDLMMNKATKRATLNLPNYENVETFRVASRGTQGGERESQINTDNTNKRDCVEHSFARFSVVSSKEMAEPSFRAHGNLAAAIERHSRPISLPSRHMMVVTKMENDAMEYDSDEGSDKPSKTSGKRLNEEIGHDLIKKLKSAYVNEKADVQIGVKSEWSTDSE
mmetsp:Transcript_12426/g.27010  ORF Transcript_12426/g.27010 Transcript_12426/m.27010 type:complete len:1424 (-) Transcript_12426:161-4432(-)